MIGGTRDLTLVAVIIGVLTCPSPNGEGILLSAFLCDVGVGFPHCEASLRVWGEGLATRILNRKTGDAKMM
jgi:hypothetical protein